MPITQAINSKANIKKLSSADVPFAPQQPVLARYEATSSLGQTTISLPFSIDQALTDQFLLFINGLKLRLGAGNDYVFSSVDQFNTSSVVTLNQALPANLNIEAYKLGLKKESEFLTDNRFTSLYESVDKGFQGFVNTTNFLLTPTTSTPITGQFWSTIKGRAKLVDLSQDLKPRLGVERIQIQKMKRLPAESGPSLGSGFLAVHGITNDLFGQIRLVGPWFESTDANGYRPTTTNVDDYVEVTWYGTGLNLISIGGQAGPFRDIRATIDNGSEGANIVPASESGANGGLGFPNNVLLPVARGLALGVHTAKIRLASVQIDLYGFEFLNESTSLLFPAGVGYIQDKKISKSTQDFVAYGSGFAHAYGSAGAKGGRVIAYLNADGTVAKDIQYTDASLLTGTSTDHSNEELLRAWHWREFGAGINSQDFSDGLSVAANYTQNDNTTALSASDQALNPATYETFYLPNGHSLQFTFIGTGLDIAKVDTGGGTLDTHTLYIDNTLVFTAGGAGANTNLEVIPLASGLPYGTHTFTMYRTTTANQAIAIVSYNVYGPKKPVIPYGALELAEYFLPATFVANTTLGRQLISTGVIRKSSSIEMDYIQGTGGSSDWSSANNQPQDYIYGIEFLSDRLNAAVKTSFFGTGFDLRFTGTSATADARITLNGLALTATNFPTAIFTPYSGITYDSVTNGSLNMSSASGFAQGFSVHNLPLGNYDFTLRNNVASSFMNINSLDIISPIHAPQSAGPYLVQNILPIGNCNLKDLRNTSSLRDSSAKVKNVSTAIPKSGLPYSTVSGTLVSIPDMHTTIEVKSDRLRISYSFTASASSSGTWTVQAFVDQKAVGTPRIKDTSAGGINQICDSFSIPITPGFHHVHLEWASGAGTITAYSNSYSIDAREE